MDDKNIIRVDVNLNDLTPMQREWAGAMAAAVTKVFAETVMRPDVTPAMCIELLSITPYAVAMAYSGACEAAKVVRVSDTRNGIC